MDPLKNFLMRMQRNNVFFELQNILQKFTILIDQFFCKSFDIAAVAIAGAHKKEYR